MQGLVGWFGVTGLKKNAAAPMLAAVA